MPQVCSQCARINPPEAAYCYYDGAILAGHSANGGPVNAGAQSFPSPFYFPSGQMCRNFDQLATTCQQHWPAAVDLLKQGFLASFLGGLGRADLALAAQEAARFPDHDRGLDQLLAKLPTQVLQEPKLKAEPTEVNLGQIAIGTDRSFELHLMNQGMRLVYGSVVSDCKWLTLGEAPGNPQKLFQFGSETAIPVQVRGQHLRAGTKPLEGRLVIESNGGTATLKVRAEVPITPFSEGALAGALTPRNIAEKAKAAPQAAAPLFETGAVARWFTQNGWTYPVQGPSASGLGAVQQFFEALGLAKAPKVEIGATSLSLKGEVGQTVQTTLEVRTPEKKPVFAHAVCDQPWLDVSKTKLNGRIATVSVVATVPNQPGETLQANITVTGNGNQRFQVPLTLVIGGTSPFSGLGGSGVAPAPAAAPATVAVTPAEAAVAGVAAANPFSMLEAPAAAIAPASVSAAAATPAVSTPAPSGAVSPFAISTAPTAQPLGEGSLISTPRLRPSSPLWIHLVPLAVLFLALIGVLLRDMMAKPPSPQAEADDVDPTPRVGLYFDSGESKMLSFGLVKVDPSDPQNAGKYSRLTFDPKGQTNSTVISIDKMPILFGGSSGKWEEKPVKFENRQGMAGTWAISNIAVTQAIEVIAGEPVELAPELYKRLYDRALIRFKIKNKDSRKRNVGLRFILDTMIGQNDMPPFTLPGEKTLVDTFKDFPTAQSVPDFIQALENANIQSPGIVAQLGFRLGEKLEAPSRVSLTHWPGSQYQSWDVPVITMQPLKPKDLKGLPGHFKALPPQADSAVVIYWQEKELGPGQVRELGFTYGLSSLASKSGKLAVSVGGSFVPGGEMTVVALIHEPESSMVTLELPKELSFVTGFQASQVVPSPEVVAGRTRPTPVTWRIRSTDAGNFSLMVKTNSGLSQLKRVTIQKSNIF
jgi:hypothetical protein